MFLRILSVAPPLVSLFFFSAFVVAQIKVTANCTSSYSWTFNSIGQSPCTVAAYMLGTCFGGNYTLAPLPPGDTYSGPTLETSNPCECSTVGYSLISAYTEYTLNCTSHMPPSQFPNPVPNGTYVPYWAILNLTNENLWNANGSYATGDSPEYGPGTIIGAEGFVWWLVGRGWMDVCSLERTFVASSLTPSLQRPPQAHLPRHLPHLHILGATNALCSDVQLCRPKSVHSHSIHDGIVQWGATRTISTASATRIQALVDSLLGHLCTTKNAQGERSRFSIPDGSFPNPVPAGIRVPQWALIDVTRTSEREPLEPQQIIFRWW
ncbi:hypothetical protein BGY98DRAFT_935629 [Russula aff. rugulosa BPL654]|nr:hypothetical protein BGY98DRAFT_935629 [Russula aff. rugulosa BPL654]